MASPPFKVKAVYEYTSPHQDDLHFPNGQIITVTEEEDEDWYMGEYVDASGVKQEGIFPRNFVEKYEPTAPPRPTRTARPKKEPEPVAPEPAPIQPAIESPTRDQVAPEPEEPEDVPEPFSPAREPPPSIPKAQAPPQTSPKTAEHAPPMPAVASKPAPAPSKPAPPPVSEKPSGGSFRDRIAAFNKAAPPPAPFKPAGFSGASGSSFIKKPFVAPPPSKNAYVPPPREAAPVKIYRRDEDPEIAAKETEDRELAERAGFSQNNNDEAEEQPKPTSLKERIALLQKQQMEQANRHADAAQKKEKPKRPAKKRTESHEGAEEAEGVNLERRDTGDTAGKKSMDSVREDIPRPTPRRKSSTKPSVPSVGLSPRKSFGDGNEADMSGAGDTTEEPEEMSTGRDDSDEKPRTKPTSSPRVPTHEPDVGEEEGAIEEETPADEEDDIDPELRRKEELRARMAKMSGGMGMHGMFGGGMPMPVAAPPKKKKISSSGEKRSGEYGADDVGSPSPRAPPVPMMVPLPGLSRVRSPEEVNKQIGDENEYTPISLSRPADEVVDVEAIVPERSAPPPVPSQDASGAPPIPGGRPAPPPVPKDSRPIVSPSVSMSPSAGSESDDEISQSIATPVTERAPPPRPLDAPGSPRSSTSAKRTSFFGADQGSPSDPTTPSTNRRGSRVPPIPGAPAVASPQVRAPPPPPPAGALSRTSTGDQRIAPPPPQISPDESEGEVTEYEGDYDTDIASAVPHKDALKAHARDSDDSATLRSPIQSPTFAPPPLPTTTAPRAIPPPLPSQPPPTRQSVDMPRAAPPPPPPAKGPVYEDYDDDEYDPYKYTAPKAVTQSFSTPTPRVERHEEDLYSASPPRSYTSQERGAPPPPPREPAPAPSGKPPAPRQSLDVHRSGTSARRSVELSRMSMDSGFMANDIDLARGSNWWVQRNGAPPALQNRKDLLYESEESTSSKRGGKSIITKDLYVLFQDYSQTIITAKYDAQDPSDVTLEQRHEQPPSRLRQDQLEEAYERFGRKVSEAVSSKQLTVVGDGTPHGLIQELLKPFADALLPVGTRAYGALVYSNLANAHTQSNDEIRPGDIITLRNTRFQGKHGAMHAKYSMEVGKPDHVGVVAEWDGSKKKVRAWEQGRESKKVKMESFKLDDLRSGEVKIWRIMPRSYVGWEGQN